MLIQLVSIKDINENSFATKCYGLRMRMYSVPSPRHDRTVRQSCLELIHTSIYCMVPKIFNHLPNDIKDQNVAQYKNKLCKFLTDKMLL